MILSNRHSNQEDQEMKIARTLTTKPQQPANQAKPQTPPKDDWEKKWEEWDQFQQSSNIRRGAFVAGGAVLGGLLGNAARDVGGFVGHAGGAVLGAGGGSLAVGGACMALLGSGGGENSSWAGLSGLLYGGAVGAVAGTVAGGLLGTAGMGLGSVIAGAATGGLGGFAAHMQFENYMADKILS